MLTAAGMIACSSGEPAGPPRAVIVDQLGATDPNAEFVERATEKLQRAGYAVDYYPSEQVSVELFSQLDDVGYDFLVLRVHMARFQGEWRGQSYDNPVLFTSEPYTADQYIDEQWELELNPVFAYEGAPEYFGVGPNFVQSGGDFDGAAVVLMGCSGLSTDALAQAFVAKGADEVVGWNDLVSAQHTDEATLRLLDHMLFEQLSPQQAVARTNSEVGTDPVYQSYLLSYAP